MNISNYIIKVLFFVFIPPSQPSPTGEGAETKLFPLGGNGKGGNDSRESYNICNKVKLNE